MMQWFVLHTHHVWIRMQTVVILVYIRAAPMHAWCLLEVVEILIFVAWLIIIKPWLMTSHMLEVCCVAHPDFNKELPAMKLWGGVCGEWTKQTVYTGKHPFHYAPYTCIQSSFGTTVNADKTLSTWKEHKRIMSTHVDRESCMVAFFKKLKVDSTLLKNPPHRICCAVRWLDTSTGECFTNVIVLKQRQNLWEVGLLITAYVGSHSTGAMFAPFMTPVE